MTPNPTPLHTPDPLQLALLQAGPALPVAVAYSGGADSSALLHAAQQLWPGQVVALHIHHGLQAAADDFVRHCEGVCAQLGVPLHTLRVHAHNAKGESPADAARRARYRALAQAIAALPAPTRPRSLLVAQHADDQIETLLLALSRGAGLPGLAAMPAQWHMGDLPCYRPFLHLPGAHLRAWLQAQNLSWIEDPSNQSLYYTRNRIRHQLLPALEAVFPQFRSTFARSAAHSAQAQQLLQELAEEDLRAVGTPPQIAALQSLSHARQANALRHWLATHCHTQAAAPQMAELQKQIERCTTRGHRIELKIGHGRVVRSGGALLYQPQPSGF